MIVNINACSCSKKLGFSYFWIFFAKNCAAEYRNAFFLRFGVL